MSGSFTVSALRIFASKARAWTAAEAVERVRSSVGTWVGEARQSGGEPQPAVVSSCTGPSSLSSWIVHSAAIVDQMSPGRGERGMPSAAVSVRM